MGTETRFGPRVTCTGSEAGKDEAPLHDFERAGRHAMTSYRLGQAKRAQYRNGAGGIRKFLDDRSCDTSPSDEQPPKRKSFRQYRLAPWPSSPIFDSVHTLRATATTARGT
eukprot:scaffold1094_cov167-Pinguiococcus_pyrenoidosus.AAC.1